MACNDDIVIILLRYCFTVPYQFTMSDFEPVIQTSDNKHLKSTGFVFLFTVCEQNFYNIDLNEIMIELVIYVHTFSMYMN